MADSTARNETGAPAQVAKDEAVDRVHDVAATTAEHAGAVKEEAKGKALNVVHDVRHELESQGDVQAKRAASTLRDVGSQLNEMARGAQPGAVTDVTRQIAERSTQFASRLEAGGVQGVGEDLRQFARRQPGLFLAAAGLAGFVVTRMLRNASQDQQAAPTPSGSGFAPSELPTASSNAPVGAKPPTGTLR
jgi:hypothetical protein